MDTRLYSLKTTLVGSLTTPHLQSGKNNSLQDRVGHIFLSASKLYPASCLMNEECYLEDKKSAFATRRDLLWGLCQREPRGSPRGLPTSVSGGETLDPTDNSLMLFRNGTNFTVGYINILAVPFSHVVQSSFHTPHFLQFHFLWELLSQFLFHDSYL